MSALEVSRISYKATRDYQINTTVKTSNAQENMMLFWGLWDPVYLRLLMKCTNTVLVGIVRSANWFSGWAWDALSVLGKLWTERSGQGSIAFCECLGIVGYCWVSKKVI